MRSQLLSPAVALVSMSAIVTAAPLCPAEVKEARELLTARTAMAGKPSAAPKSQAGAHGQEIQAPRQQDVQAPRGQETQAPRHVASNARAAIELLKYLP